MSDNTKVALSKEANQLVDKTLYQFDKLNLSNIQILAVLVTLILIFCKNTNLEEEVVFRAIKESNLKDLGRIH